MYDPIRAKIEQYQRRLSALAEHLQSIGRAFAEQA
jgi:hypothetical protein